VSIEYDLPIAANVTVEICDPDVGIAPSCRPALRQVFSNQSAGWHAVSVRVTGPPIGPGAVYRITAERGTLSQPETYFIGRYTQLVQFDWRDNSASTGSAALSVNGGTPVTITGSAVGTRKLDRVRFGAVQSVDAGTRGTFFLDDFQSLR
jgi:hypothetical protein